MTIKRKKSHPLKNSSLQYGEVLIDQAPFQSGALLLTFVPLDSNTVAGPERELSKHSQDEWTTMRSRTFTGSEGCAPLALELF